MIRPSPRLHPQCCVVAHGQSRCQLMSWFGIACELHRDWRNDNEALGTLFSNHLPSYRCLITSYMAGKTAKK